MKTIIYTLLLTVIFSAGSNYKVTAFQVGPPTQCQDLCIREYCARAIIAEDQYRNQLHNVVNDAMIALVAAWANYFDNLTSYGNYVSPMALLWLNDNIYRNIATADLQYYDLMGSHLRDYNICLGNCPQP